MHGDVSRGSWDSTRAIPITGAREEPSRRDSETEEAGYFDEAESRAVAVAESGRAKTRG